jgi:hypothetical protein
MFFRADGVPDFNIYRLDVLQMKPMSCVHPPVKKPLLVTMPRSGHVLMLLLRWFPSGFDVKLTTDFWPCNLSQRASTRYQLVIDILDVWLPASALGLVNINDGTVGVLG